MLPKEFSVIALILFIPELVKCASNSSSFNTSGIVTDTTTSFSSMFTISSPMSLFEGVESFVTSASVGRQKTNITANLASSTVALNSPLKEQISSTLISPSISNTAIEMPSTTVNGTSQYLDSSTVNAQAAARSTARFSAASPAITSARPSLNTSFTTYTTYSFTSSGVNIALETFSSSSWLGTSTSLPLPTGLSTGVSPSLSPVVNTRVPSSAISTFSPSSSKFKSYIMASERISAVIGTTFTNSTSTISSSDKITTSALNMVNTTVKQVERSTTLSNIVPSTTPVHVSGNRTSPISPRPDIRTSAYQQTITSLAPYRSLSTSEAVSSTIGNTFLTASLQETLGPLNTAILSVGVGSSSTMVEPMVSPAFNNTSIPSNISLQATDSVTLHFKTTETNIFNSGILTSSLSKKLRPTSTIAVSRTERSSYVPATSFSIYVPTTSQALPTTKKTTDNKNKTVLYAAIGGGGGAIIIIILIIACCVVARKRNGRSDKSIKLKVGEAETGEKIDWNLKWSTMRQHDVFARKSVLQMTVYGEANDAFLTDLDEKNNKPSAFLDLSGNGVHEDTEVDENSNDDVLLRCRTFSGSGNRQYNGGRSLIDVVKQKRKSRELDADIVEEVFEENEQPNATVDVESKPNNSRQIKQSSLGSFTGSHEPSKTGPSLSFIEDAVPKHSSFSEDQTVSLASGKSGSLREIDETEHDEESNNQGSNPESQLKETPNESHDSPTGEDAGIEPNSIDNEILEQESLSGSTETSLISDKGVTPAASSQDSLPVKNLEPGDAEKRLSEYYC